jgi:hypothetical protein
LLAKKNDLLAQKQTGAPTQEANSDGEGSMARSPVTSQKPLQKDDHFERPRALVAKDYTPQGTPPAAIPEGAFRHDEDDE